LNYETNEKKLKKEFEIYGPVKRIRIVKDSNGKSRGYAFIEYEHKSDFKTAYKRAEMKRIDNNRVRVDFERGRTDSSFKPRYLGGGKGETRRITKWVEKEIKAIKESYPEIANKYRKNEMLSRKRSRSISRSEEEKKSIILKKRISLLKVMKDSTIKNCLLKVILTIGKTIFLERKKILPKIILKLKKMF